MKTILPVLVAAGLALTQATTLAQDALAQDAAQKQIKLSIERKALRDALNDWARQTGYQLISEVSGAYLSPTITGTLTPSAALEQLLAGSPFTYKWLNDRVVAVHKREIAPESSQTATTHGQPRLLLAQLDETLSTPEPPRQARASQAPDAANSVGPRSDRIETVLVTAQRRTERLLDVPLSMSVLGVDEVEHRGIVSREDYLRSIPSVSVRDDGVGLAEIVIRGAYGDSFRTGPTVGLYFGDVPLTGYAIGGSADIKLIDIQRVEVLRGPQGTLYGSNALSGAVRYIAAEPDLQEFSGSLRAGYSNTAGNGGDNTAIDGVLNLPLVADKFAVRAVGYRHYNEGYVQNVAGSDPAMQAAAATSGATNLAINKDQIGTTEYLGGRVSALWQPTDALSLNLTYVKQTDSQDDRLFEQRQAGPYKRSDYQLGSVIGGSDGAQRIDLDILNLTAQYEFGWGSLYSSTASMEQRFVRKWDIGSLTSIFGTPLKPISQRSTTDADIFTQELRFTSKFDGPFQIITGLYYEDSEQPTQQPTFFAGDPALNPFAAIKLWQIDLERDVEQKAAYGQLSYAPIRQLKLTVGGRYFDYDSRFSTRTFDSVIPAVAPSFSNATAGESGETYKAGVEFKPSEESLIYASWSQGFRLGRPLATALIRALCDRDQNGTIDNTSISSTLDAVDSDRLDSYEIGAKLGFMGGRGTVTTAIYQNDWSDIPVVFQPPGCPTTLTLNGGTARARGFEGEASFRFFETVKLMLGLGYVDSELTATTSLGRDGDELNFTPEFNGSLGLEVGFSLAQRNGYVRSDYTYFGSYYTQTGHRGIRAEGYDLLNLRAALDITPSSQILLHVDNLLDADDFTTVVGPSGFPPGYSVRLRPRTIGVGLTYRF